MINTIIITAAAIIVAGIVVAGLVLIGIARAMARADEPHTNAHHRHRINDEDR